MLDGLTALTGEAKYRQAAEDAARYAMENLRTPNGLLCWGGHFAWDLEGERPAGQHTVHEMKNHQPYYSLMWRVDPQATRKLMETVWAGHIVDWSRIDYNRHASTTSLLSPQWDHQFAENIDVPFPAVGGNRSFANVTPPLMHAGVMLAVLDNNTHALTWTRRLAYRWQQARDPKTGLCGGQLSYRKRDRAANALGHVHPNINEAKIVADYHQRDRYGAIPLAQMRAGENLISAGGRCAKVGREFIQWASDDLKAYARGSYDHGTGRFIAMMIDGTPIKWQQSRKGYYVPKSFAPIKPEGRDLWNYAMAYRLTRDAAHWTMVRELGRQLGLGDVGRPDGGRDLRFDTDREDWQTIYALIELHRATKDRAMLRMAARIADNLLKMQRKNGLFPRPGRTYARTGDQVPLAILHLAAAIDGKQSLMPPPTLDNSFFHSVYDGVLEEYQKKRADKRTYDWRIFYGSK